MKMKASIHILILLAVSLLPALVVNHLPPAVFSSDQQTEIRIEVIQGLKDVSAVELMYKVQGSGPFSSTRMENDGSDTVWMKGYLPIPAVSSQSYEYYFKFTMITGAVQTYPLLEPENHPFVIQPETKTGDYSEAFILLSDEQSFSAKEGYLLAVSWFALEGLIEKESITVYVNGKNVTKSAYIGDNMLLYKEKTSKPGIMTAYVTARTNEGKELFSKNWTTVIKGTNDITALPLNLRGTLNAGSNVMSTANDPSASTFGSDLDDGWTSLDMYANYKKLNLLSYFYLSTLQDEDIQNVNKFRLGVFLPYWDTYVGDYTPHLSSLTMSNKSIRGIYTKLHTKNIALSFAQGEMIRAITGTETVDSETRETIYGPGTFKQEAIAARLQLGSEKGFLLGFNTTRNRDIISSLDDKYVTKADSTQIAFPKDNLVFSTDARLTLLNTKTVLGIEGAGSLYNRNTLPGAFTTQELNDYLAAENEVSFNPQDFDDIFIINTNMEPLPLSADLTALKSVVAWQTYLRNMFLNNLLNISYSSVGAAFHALSTSYMQNDASQLVISDQYTYKQFLILAGGFSQVTDNLSKSSLDTNTNSNYYLQSLLRIPQYPYLSMSYTNSSGKNELNNKIELTDSTLYIPYKSATGLLSIGLGYEFSQIPTAPTTVDLGLRLGNSYRETDMNSRGFEKQYEYDANNLSLGLTSRFTDIPLKTQFTFANNVLDGTLAGNNTTKSNFNFLMRGDYRLLENRVNPWLEYRLTSLSGDQDKQSYNYLTLGVDTRPLPDTNVSTSLGWQLYGNKDTQDVDYTKTIWRLTLTQRF